jgi:hypothetical protein
MLILLSQNEQGISALDLQKHIFPSGSSSMKSTFPWMQLHYVNRFNIHRCSYYCLKNSKTSKEKACRMEFGTESSPGKEIRETPALVKDNNGSLQLEMSRDHPSLVQHSTRVC